MELDKIYNMNCIEMMRGMPDACVDLCITDPPYDVNYMSKVAGIRRCDKGIIKHTIDSVDGSKPIDWHEFYSQLYRLMKDGTHCYIFCSDWQFTRHDIQIIIRNSGFNICQLLIWNKDRATIDFTFGLKYPYKHEFIMYLRKGMRKLRETSCKRQTTVFDIATDNKGTYSHPCQKPIELLKILIKASSYEGDLVFDPFMGSGATAKAARAMGRHYLGCEIAPEYCRLIESSMKTCDMRRFL